MELERQTSEQGNVDVDICRLLYTKINFNIYTKLFQLLLPCGIRIMSWNIIYACVLP